MKLLNLIDEDFVNFKIPSMYLAFPYCSFKCEKECGEAFCQNKALIKEPIIEVDPQKILTRFLGNPITKAMVFGGLEPLDSWEDIQYFISFVRNYTAAPIIIYTGYNEDEVQDKIKWLELYENIIVKFGRFIPNQEKHFDEVLGVELVSPNQYAKWINKL